ncbi:hypothetical protein GLOIN_2v1777080 [Rhizophagus irregularis DAOM 181602=DAOM 197198]|nr:hypothetical protein GLOIN_2v1777080 [Rhizophagus irregularis DAOM 181602=DAOM 197198]
MASSKEQAQDHASIIVKLLVEPWVHSKRKQILSNSYTELSEGMSEGETTQNSPGVTPQQKKKFEAKRVNGSVTLPNESLLHLEGNFEILLFIVSQLNEAKHFSFSFVGSRLPGCYSKFQDTYHQRFGPGLYFEDDQSPGAKSNLFSLL